MEEFRDKIYLLRNKVKNLQKENRNLIKDNELLKKQSTEYKNQINHLKQLEQNNHAKMQENFSYKKKYFQLLKTTKQDSSQNLDEKNYNPQYFENKISDFISKQLGQWNQVLEKINLLNKEYQSLKKKILKDRHRNRVSLKRLKKEEIRIGLFVDVQNIFYGARQFNAKLDFDLLLKKTVNHRRLIRAFAYVVQSADVDQSGFLTMLQHKSFEVKSKTLRLRSDGTAKADWDVAMTVDILSMVDYFDVVILVSGDGDFVPLVNMVKTRGALVEVYSFIQNTSRDLIESADSHFPIDQSFLKKDEYAPLNFATFKQAGG